MAGSSVLKHSAAETSCSTAPLLHRHPSISWCCLVSNREASLAARCYLALSIPSSQHPAHSKCHLQTATALSC